MTDFGGWEHATLVKFAGEAVAKIERMERALAWIEDKARARKLEIAPSLLGSGFEFGFWPKGDAKVVNARCLLDAVEAAQKEAC
jgi:hypothetical protein